MGMTEARDEEIITWTAGSRAHGLAVEGSDVDRHVIRPLTVDEELLNRPARASHVIVDGDDVTVTPVTRWVVDLVEGHPNAIEGLWSDPTAGDLGRVAVNLRGVLLTTHVAGILRAMSASNISLLDRKGETSAAPKLRCEALREIIVSRVILEEGIMPVRIRVDDLLAVKTSSMTVDEWAIMMTDEIARADRARASTRLADTVSEATKEIIMTIARESGIRVAEAYRDGLA